MDRRPYSAALGQALTWSADAHEREAAHQRAIGNEALAQAHAQAARLSRLMRALGAPQDSPNSEAPSVPAPEASEPNPC